MSIKRTLARNLVWNWAGMATQVLVGFLVTPYLVHQLGDTTYGLWILIGSLTGYFGLLDLGVRGSVGRHVAFHRAKGDSHGVNVVIGTALGLMSVASVLALVLTAIAQIVFFRLFTIPPEHVQDVRIALLIVGLNLALTFPLSLFDAMLWASQRFDQLNAVEVPAAVLRAILTVLLVRGSDSLVTLATITLTVTIGSAIPKAIAALRGNPSLQLRPSYLNAETARSLMGYGIWFFLLTVARLFGTLMTPLLIGAWLSVKAVTPYSIASRLVGFAGQILIASTGILTPVTTALHAEQKHDQQERLFLEGSKYCTCLSLFFSIGLILLGPAFIILWIGRELDGAALLLTIITVGEVFPMSQWVSYSVMLGVGQPRKLATLVLIEDAIAVALAAILTPRFHLVGICVAFAAPGLIFRGLGQMVYACRTIDVPLRRYAARVIMPALAAAVVPALVLGMLVRWRPPVHWKLFVPYTAVFVLLYTLSSAMLVANTRLAPYLATAMEAVRSYTRRTAMVPHRGRDTR